MKRSIFPQVALSALLPALLLLSCAETPEALDPGTADDAEQALRVQTWLELGDVVVADSPVRIERFRIPSGRLAFISVDGEDTLLAMTSAIDLDFTVDNGEIRVAGPEIDLPDSGEWQVRLHVAPTTVDPGVSRSVIVHGTWDAERDHGEPSPLPWRPEVEKSTSPQAFTWTTSVSATVDLDTFLLDADASGLVVRVPLEEWIVNVLEPALRERLATTTPGEQDSETPNPDDLPEHDNVRNTLLEDDGMGLSRLLERVSASFQSTH